MSEGTFSHVAAQMYLITCALCVWERGGGGAGGGGGGWQGSI